MGFKSLARKVFLQDEIDLVAAVDLVATDLFSDQWTQNRARTHLPFVRIKDKESGRIKYYKYGFDDDTGKQWEERVVVPKELRSDLKDLALMQMKARLALIGLIRNGQLSGSIAFSEKYEPLDKTTSFLTRAYRRVFCSSMVRRGSNGAYEFGYITVEKSKLGKALNSAENNPPGLREGSDWHKGLLSDFYTGISALIEERYGKVTAELPFFTNSQVNSILSAVLFDGLNANGTRDEQISSESDNYKKPSKKKLREYAAKVLPARCLKQESSGRRSSKRQAATAEVLKYLGIEG